MRGFALFGVLLVNMYNFGATSPIWTDSSDRLALSVMQVVFETKSFRLFSLLFGFGITLQMLRADERQARVLPFHLRRMLVLFAIGMGHTLLYDGDVLMLYAEFGLIVLLIRRAPTRMLLAAWLVLSLVFPVERAARALVDGPRQVPPVETRLEQARQRHIDYEQSHPYAVGSIVDVMALNARHIPPNPIDETSFLAMCLLGVVVGRRRILEHLDAHQRLIRRASRKRTRRRQHVHGLAAGRGRSRTRGEPGMSRILIVEDEPSIALGLQGDLTLEGYDVEVAGNGDDALQRLHTNPYDLVLLDVMLPGKDGFAVCREVRRARLPVCIILLTARSEEAEKVLGLELGADDYVTKPFSPLELRARVKAVLRRGSDDDLETYRFGDVEVDFARGEVRRAGDEVGITAIELKLLGTFIRRRGRVLSRDQLLDEVWGHDSAPTDRVVDNHIMNLRRKVEPEPETPRFVVSLRGQGYRFDG